MRRLLFVLILTQQSFEFRFNPNDSPGTVKIHTCISYSDWVLNAAQIGPHNENYSKWKDLVENSCMRGFEFGRSYEGQMRDSK